MIKIAVVLFSFPFSVPVHLLGSAAGDDTLFQRYLFICDMTGCVHSVTNDQSESELSPQAEPQNTTLLMLKSATQE